MRCMLFVPMCIAVFAQYSSEYVDVENNVEFG